jgi:hypothetical protein
MSAKAGDYQIMPDYIRDPSWSIHQAYVLKDTAGNIIASWSKPNSTTWSFHDPYNKISVHMGANGAVTDLTFN